MYSSSSPLSLFVFWSLSVVAVFGWSGRAIDCVGPGPVASDRAMVVGPFGKAIDCAVAGPSGRAIIVGSGRVKRSRW